jgi:hypothetical protein
MIFAQLKIVHYTTVNVVGGTLAAISMWLQFDGCFDSVFLPLAGVFCGVAGSGLCCS